MLLFQNISDVIVLGFDGRQFFEVFWTHVDVIHIPDIILMSDAALFSKQPKSVD